MANDVEQRGVIFTGQAPTVVRNEAGRWMIDALSDMRRYAQGIAPVDTGAYRSSLTATPPRQVGGAIEAMLFSTDIPGKVKVIEFGFPAARPDLKGRAGVFVFRRTHDTFEGAIGAAARQLGARITLRLNQ